MIAGTTGSENLMTAAELLQNDVPHKSTELVRGRLIVRAPGANHGRASPDIHSQSNHRLLP